MTPNLHPSTLRQVQREPLYLGLIGCPLGHSLSPTLHHAALKSLGLEGEYRLYPVPPESPPATRHLSSASEHALENLLAQMRAGEIHGLNVTIPHKQTVIPLLDELTPAAQAIGAVNTIIPKAGRLIGDNTDAPGFWADVQQRLNLQPSNALILGSGGSARAVVYALLSHGWHITIAARRLEQANALAVDLGILFPTLQPSTCNLQFDKLELELLTLIINTTPLGMSPHVDASPWPADAPFPENAAIYDVVYNPRETLLVKRARAAGLQATTGLGMLVEQAALAFSRWTGCDPPSAVMRQAVDLPTQPHHAPTC